MPVGEIDIDDNVCMVQEPESYSCEVIMACPLSEKKNEKKIDTKCNFSALKIVNGKRQYDTSKNNEGVFEIVCGEKNTYGRVKIDLHSLVGPPAPSSATCYHKSKVFDLNFTPISRTDSHVDVNLKAPFKGKEDFFKTLGGMLWPISVDAVEYSVAANTCGNHKEVVIRAYPDIKTKFAIEGKKEKEGGLEFVLFGKDAAKSKDKFFEIFENPSTFFAITFESKYDAETLYSLNIANSQDKLKLTKFPSFQTLKVLYNGVFKMSDVLDAVLSKGAGSLKLYMKPGVSFNCSRTEMYDSVFADYDVNVSVGFDPLIKITGDYDFAGPVLASIPGIGTALLAVKWLIEKCNAGQISLKFIASGSVSFTGKLSRSSKKWDCDIDPKGVVDFRFEFKAEYTITVDFGIGSFNKSGKFQATARTGVKAQPTKDKAKKYEVNDSGIYIYMDVTLCAAVLYYLKGTKNGATVTMPGNAPLYVRQQNDDAPDDKEDTKGIPDNQKYEIWPEYPLESMSGYVELISFKETEHTD